MMSSPGSLSHPLTIQKPISSFYHHPASFKSSPRLPADHAINLLLTLELRLLSRVRLL